MKLSIDFALQFDLVLIKRDAVSPIPIVSVVDEIHNSRLFLSNMTRICTSIYDNHAAGHSIPTQDIMTCLTDAKVYVLSATESFYSLCALGWNVNDGIVIISSASETLLEIDLDLFKAYNLQLMIHEFSHLPYRRLFGFNSSSPYSRIGENKEERDQNNQRMSHEVALEAGRAGELIVIGELVSFFGFCDKFLHGKSTEFLLPTMKNFSVLLWKTMMNEGLPLNMDESCLY